MSNLSELKLFHDFEVLATGNDGVNYDGPNRCQPLEVISRCIADGQVWERCQTWLDKGLGTYKSHYMPVEEGPDPSEEYWKSERAKARQATEDFLKEFLEK